MKSVTLTVHRDTRDRVNTMKSTFQTQDELINLALDALEFKLVGSYHKK